MGLVLEENLSPGSDECSVVVVEDGWDDVVVVDVDSDSSEEVLELHLDAGQRPKNSLVFALSFDLFLRERTGLVANLDK